MMEMTRRDQAIGLLPLAAAVAIAIALALAAPARAATYGNGFQMSKFRVEVEGYSTTTWHRNVEPTDPCEVGDHSLGRERVTFSTVKPVVITASHMRGEFSPQLFAGRSALGVPTKARVQRSFTPAITPSALACEDNGGGGAEATKPDCGSRTIGSWFLNVEFSDKQRNALQLTSDGSAEVPYASCPGAGFTYPFLLDKVGTREARKPLYADLSQDELFDPAFQKWITIGDGSYKEASDTWWAKTDVHWAVSFTRLGDKR